MWMILFLVRLKGIAVHGSNLLIMLLHICHNIIGKEDAFDVKCAIVNIAARFYSVGCALGLPASILDKIQNDNPRDSEKALMQVINMWLAQNFNAKRFGAPSWRTLVNALAEPAGGNDSLLAKEVAEDHPGNYMAAYVLCTYYNIIIIIVSRASKTSLGGIN